MLSRSFVGFVDFVNCLSGGPIGANPDINQALANEKGESHEPCYADRFAAYIKLGVTKMDWLTFFAKVLEALAWPVAAVALVALLRSEISKLAPHLKKFKAGPLEAEFEREIKELKASTPEQEKSAEAKQPDPASKSFLFQLAALHPRSAILETWVRVEAAARAVLAKPVAVATTTYVPAVRLAEQLAQRGILNQAQVTLFHELRRLRNDVAHAQGFEPTQESALAYIDLGVFLQGFLEGKLQ